MESVYTFGLTDRTPAHAILLGVSRALRNVAQYK